MKWIGDEPQKLADKGAKPSAHKGKKTSTSKWCKGKVGREHVPVLQTKGFWKMQECQLRGNYDKKQSKWVADVAWLCVHLYVCEKCGKHLGHPVKCPSKPSESLIDRWLWT